MDGAMSRKDLIEQLIIESKKRKLEKQKLKEETLDLTEKLDTEWKDLHSVVSKDFNKEIEDKKQEKPSLIDKLLSEHNKKNEEYDKTMRELKFEPRGTVIYLSIYFIIFFYTFVLFLSFLCSHLID